MRILLTGGDGFIGRNLTDYLTKKKIPILSIVRRSKRKNNKKNLTFIKTDIKNIDLILNKIKKFKPSVVIHLAWDKIPDFSYENSKENYLNSKSFLEKLNKIETIKKIIISGSCFEDKKITPKIKYFIKFKKKLKEWSINFFKNKSVYWLKIYYIYGHGQRPNSLIPYLIKNLLSGKKFEIKSLTDKNNYIHISDFCSAVKLLLKKNFKSQTFNIKYKYKTPNYNLCKFAELRINKKNILFKKKYKKLILEINNKKITGWIPKIDFFKGINDMVNKYKK